MNKTLKSILPTIVLLFWGTLSSAIMAQTRAVSGLVLDENGEPLTGATVVQKGTTNAAITDLDGHYQLSVPESTIVLEFSYIGYQTAEKSVTAKQQTVDVTLLPDAKLMDEVVVTAFAKQKKVNVTGAISSINGSEVLSSPVANVSTALLGTAAGVSGLQSSGEPGRNDANLHIRGISTYGSSAPLIIIDGVEQSSEQAMAEFNAMDANEIQGISILKDASSTAVYGVRGANGVIIVTTKRGATGKPTINFSANYGVTKATTLQEGVTSYEYALFRNEAIRNEQNGFPGKEVQEQSRLHPSGGRSHESHAGAEGCAQRIASHLLRFARSV